MAKKPLKTDKIGHISACNFVSVRFTKCVLTFAFSIPFMNQCKTKFIPYLLGFLTLAAKFQKFPGKLWNLAIKFLARPKSKIPIVTLKEKI